MERTSNDIAFSQYWFRVTADANDVGYGNQIIMGNGSTNIAKTYNNQYANYPAMYRIVNKVTAGDNVTWEQTGFQHFIDGDYSVNSAQYTFGQNFTLKAPITTRPGAINLEGNQKVTFAAGASLDINQTNNDAVFIVTGTSSIMFTSPRQLHLAIIQANGAPVTSTSAGIIRGTGTVTLNNSNINTWLVGHSQSGKDSADSNAQFAQMDVKNGIAYLTDVGGNPEKDAVRSNIITSNTRELQTLAIPVGKMAVQFVDQFGKTIKVGTNSNGLLNIPLTDKDNYIGQYLSLIHI